MSTEGALGRSRLLPTLLGMLLLLMGLAMLAGGIKLSMLGGSLYYLLAGIGIVLSGVLLIAARRAALGLYALVLFASTLWALWEVGLDWWAYGRSEVGDRYSPLKQITPANVGKLQEAWRIQTGDLPTADDPVELTNENTPLKANGMLYACTAHSKVLALDPDTGKELWRFDPQIKSPVGFKGFAHMTCRGVSYYDEAAYAKSETAASAVISEAGKAVAQACPRRLYLPTADARLIALNADTGKVCEGFGKNGVVDLTQGIGPFTPGGYYATSPAAITRDLVIMGGHVTDNESTNEPSGVIRAFDVHDGHLV